jgi:hypothetical protein
MLGEQNIRLRGCLCCCIGCVYFREFGGVSTKSLIGKSQPSLSQIFIEFENSLLSQVTEGSALPLSITGQAIIGH